MSPHPILLIGGSGIVGRWTARFLREAHPAAPLLIGSRDLAKAEEAAAQIGHAEGVALDLAADGLGLGELTIQGDQRKETSFVCKLTRVQRAVERSGANACPR